MACYVLKDELFLVTTVCTECVHGVINNWMVWKYARV